MVQQISSKIQIEYFSPQASPPVIISPKSDSHWKGNKTITFDWAYKGYDLQFEYVIQILTIEFDDIDNIDPNIESSVNSKWDNNEDINSSLIYEINNFSHDTSLTINLSSVLTGNGIFRWRIKTRGILATTFSSWANDGYVRIDNVAPFILNATVEGGWSSSVGVKEQSKLASSFADMSMPRIRTRRTDDSGYDYHIERKKRSGLYISYDYRDYSLTLRCQAGETSKRRYYGLMSFHANATNEKPSYSIQEAIKLGYVYTINSDETEGPHQQTLFTEQIFGNGTGVGLGYSLENLIWTKEQVTETSYIPKGFPKFWNVDIFDSEATPLSHPATIVNSDAISYFSVFPFNTQYVKYSSGQGRKYQVSGSSDIWEFSEFIELRYPAPYQDIFILFNKDLNKVLAYGQFEDFDEVFRLAEDPLDSPSTIISLSAGYNVETNRDSPPQRSSFTSGNLYSDISSRKNTFGWTIDNEIFPEIPYSDYLFFNLVPDENGNDVAIKFYLNKDILKSYEMGNESSSLSFLEFYFRPDSDCSLAFLGSEDSIDFYQSQIPLDEIFIGRARATPKELLMYNIDLDSDLDDNEKKKYYKYIKFPTRSDVDSVDYTVLEASQVLTPEVWGNTENYFLGYSLNSSDQIIFNGSFRIKIPDYDYIPYYHPNAVLYENPSTASAALPHIIDADPNKNDHGLIGWDSINFESAGFDSFEPKYLLKSNYINSSDFIKFDGSSFSLGQINPYLYNFSIDENGKVPWEEDYGRGTISRLNYLGFLRDGYSYGQLGYTLFNQGWSPDSVWYNLTDQGLYGLAEVFEKVSYIDSSLQIYLNGQLLTKDTDYEEKENNFEFEFINIGTTGLSETPRNNDIIGICFRTNDALNDYKSEGPYFINGDGSSNYSLRGSTFLSAGVPSSEKYERGSLKVFLNGILLEEGVEYEEKASAYEFGFLIGINGLSSLPDSSDTIGVFYNTTRTKTTSPDGGYVCLGDGSSYNLVSDFGISSSLDVIENSLKVYVNGAIQERDVDYIVTTSGGYVVSFTFTNSYESEDIISVFFDVDSDNDSKFVGPFYITPQTGRTLYSVRDYWASFSDFLSTIRLKEFSNYMFKTSLNANIEDSEISSLDSYTTNIKPDRDSSDPDRTFIWGSGTKSVLKNNIKTSDPVNGKIWIHYKDNGSDSESFIDALVGNDRSSQGFYGANGISNHAWLEEQKNIFGGNYLIAEDDSGNKIFEQIKRSIIGQYPSSNGTTIVRGDIKSLNDIPVSTDVSLSGDSFSIGNIFGHIYPKIVSGKNYVRIFFDLEEDNSGINGIKTLSVNLDIDEVESLVEANNFIGPVDIDGESTKLSILMQKLNNKVFDFSDPNSVESLEALDLISTQRSSQSLIDYYFQNILSKWNSITTPSSETLQVYNAGFGKSRYYYDLPVSGSGFKIVYIQLKDKAENTSNIYCIPFSIPSDSGDIFTSKTLDNIEISSDEDIITVDTTVTVSSKNYLFEDNEIQNDIGEFRSITLKRPLSLNDSGVYESYAHPENLLVGFSDNYGLSYNVFSPFSSIKSWRFDRPISIIMKSFDFKNRGFDWYFDPNDIRHYPVDSINDYRYGIGSGEENNIKNSWSFHIPGNATSVPVTLVGIRTEEITSSSSSWGKTNPLADKIYEFREEMIGKKLVLGSNLNLKYTILHIFRSSNLPSIKKYDVNGTVTRTIDGDSNRKVWIVIEDPDSSAALILSRKFQYYNSDNIYYNQAKDNTGYRAKLINDFDGVVGITSDFGYYEDETSIPDAVNTLVNNALGLDITGSEGGTPQSVSFGGNYFYIVPSDTLSLDSGLTNTSEGWTTQFFQGYKIDSISASENAIFESIGRSNNQLLGVNVHNKLVFGKYVNVDGIITYYDSTENAILIKDGHLDQTMIGLNYSIIDTDTDEVFSTGVIQDISSYSVNGGSILSSDNGVCIIIESDLSSLIFTGDNYIIRVEIEPLQSINPSTSTLYDYGWWPEVDGILVPPAYSNFKLGDVTLSNIELQKFLRFCSISNGSFYIDKAGYYSFKIDNNEGSYADFSIDYLRTKGTVSDVFETYNQDDELEYESRIVGGFMSHADSFKSFYLRKGWHIGRFRYLAKYSTTTNDPNYAILLYKKPDWDSDVFVPFIGSDNNKYRFMARSYRTVHCRFLDKNYNYFPKLLDISDSIDESKSSQYVRSIVGFFESLSNEVAGRFSNQVLQVEKYSENDNYGNVSIFSNKDVNLTYGGQMFEEATGTYVSSVIDGGGDFRFWRSISWTSTSQPSGTSVEFYLRTAESEEELLNRTWNNINTEDNPQIVPVITTSGQDILEFSQQLVNVSSENVVVNRYLQFKMVLKSRIKGITPIIDDVTIQYSKLNTVNFFTTTFNLNSNIIRAILTYNGEIPEDSSGVALADIQFGISTVEETDGVVSTNFDDYAIIPINEAFSLSSLGIKASPNDKFRIGIKFISTESAVPTVDEFSLMWQSSGKDIRTKDLL